MKLNKKQLLEIINKAKEEGLLEDIEYGMQPKLVEGITFNTEESHGGGEGSGENFWFVFSTDKDGVKQYWEVDGSYYSYHGLEYDWNDLYEVEPGTKVVNVWNKK